MKDVYEKIILVVITVILTASITTYAAFRASAENITFSSDKTDKVNVEESLNELYDEANKCPKGKICLGNIETTNSTKKCRRAKTLHTEICTETDTSKWCSSINENYNGNDIKNKDTIVYGNTLIIQGELHAGDAFTCDVNGDGIYDEETERFYYVSDLYTGGTNGLETFDTNYAVLIYYNNTTNGIQDSTRTSLIAYHSSNINNLGPVTALANLPSITQWNNVSLKSQTRQIRTELGTTSTSAGVISQFTYTNKAARLITYQELQQACGKSISVNTEGYLDSATCRFMLENTNYSGSRSIRTYGCWLETPFASDSNTAWITSATGRVVGNIRADDTGYRGVRPAIEVLKTDIAY